MVRKEDGIEDGSQDLPREVSVEDGKVKIEGPNGMTMTPDAALIMGARLATAADEAREAWLNDRGEEWNPGAPT